MSLVTPIKVGYLIDYMSETKEGGKTGFNPDYVDALKLVAEEFLAAGKLDRPVEIVVRHVNGLPRGSFKNVRDAFYELVEEDCLVIFGPCVSENGIPLRDHVEKTAQVPCIAMAASESMLGEWMFALPNGSMDEEPIIMAQVAQYDGAKRVGVLYEESIIGQEYLRSTRKACHDIGLEITGEVAVPQLETGKLEAIRKLHAAKPDALLSVGFGLGNLGVNAALKELGWDVPRYANTSFNFGAHNEWWRKELAGWRGIDQYDERNQVGQDFLARFEKRYGRKVDYWSPLYGYDIGRMIMTALSTAKPLTGPGVKEALERIKWLPAACGAPGTRLKFGKYVRAGWVGAEALVVRRYSDDGVHSYMHGTINGLVK
jgi:ABC-type branched-subunit amino acid transport system substrate-binding protein